MRPLAGPAYLSHSRLSSRGFRSTAGPGALRFIYRVAGALLVGLVLVAARGAHADPGQCVSLCDESMNSCAQASAAGCGFAGEAAKRLVGEAASRIPVPGLGALLSGAAGTMTEAQCKELLAPCESIRNTCYAGCGVELSSDGNVVATASRVVERSTLRIFSNVPRSIVYINGQRMGATPDDVLEPFVTPELGVGKYWVRIVSSDSLLEWEGEKDVDAGNVNAVEGTLESAEALTWRRVEQAIAAQDLKASRDQLRDYIADFPDGSHLSEASERLDELNAAADALGVQLLATLEAQTTAAGAMEVIEAFEATLGAEAAQAQAVASRRAELDRETELVGLAISKEFRMLGVRERLDILAGVREQAPELRFYEAEIAALEAELQYANEVDLSGKSGRQLIAFERAHNEGFDRRYRKREQALLISGGVLFGVGAVTGLVALPMWLLEQDDSYFPKMITFFVGSGVATIGLPVVIAGAVLRTKSVHELRQRYGVTLGFGSIGLRGSF